MRGQVFQAVVLGLCAVVSVTGCLNEDRSVGGGQGSTPGNVDPASAAASSAAADRWCQAAPKGSHTATDGIQDLWAENERNMWLVANFEYAGFYMPTDPSLVGYYIPYIFHWNGEKVCQATLESIFPAGDMRAGTQSKIWAIAGVASDDLWIGGRGFILHWDGVAWRSVPSPTKYDVKQFVVFSSTDILATDGLLLHWDGTSWTRPTPDTITGLDAETASASIQQLWLDDQRRLWATMNATAKCQLYLFTGSGITWDAQCYFPTEARWSATAVGGTGSTAWVLEGQTPLLGRKFFQVQKVDGVSPVSAIRVPDSPAIDPLIANGPWRIQGMADGQIWMPDEGAAWTWDGESFVNANGRFHLPSSHSVLRLFQMPGSMDTWAMAGAERRASEVFRSNDGGQTWTTLFSR
jgi:hypothetical protein